MATCYTVSETDPDTPSADALTEAEPFPVAVAVPLLTLATAASELVHVKETPDMVLPDASRAVAVSDDVSPSDAIVVVDAVTSIDATGGRGSVELFEQAARTSASTTAEAVLMSGSDPGGRVRHADGARADRASVACKTRTSLQGPRARVLQASDRPGADESVGRGPLGLASDGSDLVRPGPVTASPQQVRVSCRNWNAQALAG